MNITKKVIWINLLLITILSYLFLNNSYNEIFNLRFNLLLTCLSIGIIISISGGIYQILFNNILASPYTFGTASSCSLAACISIYLGISPYFPSFIASIISILIILFIRKNFSNNNLLLFGIIKGYLLSNLILFFQSLAGYSSSITSNKWIIGNIGYLDFEINFILFTTAIAFLLYTYKYSRELSIIEIDHEFSKNLLITKNIEYKLLLFSGLALSVAISTCGAIGFIGLVIPQILKIFSPKTNPFLIGSTGALYLLICLLIHQFYMQIPLNIIINLLGSPFIILLLKKR